MAEAGRIRSLRVQAAQTVDLAFNMPGVISHQNFDQVTREGPAFLGKRVNAFDFEQDVYAKLGETADDATGAVGRLKFDSTKIRELMTADGSMHLYALRNEGLAATLDQMIARREAAVLDRFMHHAEISDLMKSTVPENVAALGKLKTALKRRFQEIHQAYEADHRTGVEKSTKIVTKVPEQVTKSTSESLPMGMASTRFEGGKIEKGGITTRIFEGSGGELAQKQESDATASFPVTKTDEDWNTPTDFFENQRGVSRTQPAKQVMVTPHQAYTHPKLDNEIGSLQQQIAVEEERLRNRIAEMKLPHTEAILEGELAAMDLDVRTVQINFAHTFLMPPIGGIVTAVYKDIGESVEPGEPVIRIENDAYVMLFGRVQFKTPLWPGREMSVKVGSAFEGVEDLKLACKVVSVRGHEADDDEWEVVMEAKNPEVDGHPLLPINYHVDADTATIRLVR